ncbi:2443_t:CDS:2 [Acaulospora morrowiae]|uniref:2443_t:CDS:1 n=1 Tax=Acaulospora morrowiae TaxID=94023 RepID=A0A9N9AXN3_9GLOM|nr:2443_t:CDS:2 [Acaulospora morrowiae]
MKIITTFFASQSRSDQPFDKKRSLASTSVKLHSTDEKMSSTTATNNKTELVQLSTNYPASTEQTKVKPCCACPDTKKARDECIFQYNDEEKCKNLIEAHKACMRSFGFNI